MLENLIFKVISTKKGKDSEDKFCIIFCYVRHQILKRVQYQSSKIDISYYTQVNSSGRV